MSSLSSLLRVRSALECRRFGAASYDIYAWSLALCFGLHTLQYPEREAVRLSDAARPLSSEEIRSFSAQEFFERAARQLGRYSEGRSLCDAFGDLWGNLSNPSNNYSYLHLLDVWADLDSDSLLDAADHLAHEFVDEFYPGVQTPQWLNRLAVLLIAPINGSFYDGTAGIGDTAFEAFRYAARSGGSLSIYTSELHHLFFSISLLRAWLQNINMQQHNDDCFQQKLQGRFDHSIMFPPFGELGRTNRSDQSKDDRDSKDWRFAIHLLNSLSENGQGVCCIFSGALFNARSSKVRETLIKQNVIDAIISFPSNTLNYTAIPISLVVFRKGRKTGDAVRLIDASALIDSNGVTASELPEKIIQLYHTDIPVDGVVRRVPPEELSAKNLLPAAYPKKEFIPVHTDSWGELHIRSAQPADWIALDHAAQIYTGVNSNLIAPDGDGIPMQLIRLSDVQNGQLQSDIPTSYLQRHSVQKAFSSQVRAWDILISSKGNAIKLCLITDENAADAVYPLYLSQHFLGIHVDQSQFDPYYIYLFLKSPVGLALLSQQQIESSITILRKKDLEQLRLPHISLEKQQSFIYELQQQEIYIQEQLDILERTRSKAYANYYNQIGLKPMIKEELC